MYTRKTGADLTTKKATQESSHIYNGWHIEFINDRLGITTKMEQKRQAQRQRDRRSKNTLEKARTVSPGPR